MRDIEFRAKRLDNNKWIYGSYVFYKDFDEEENHLLFSINGNPNDIISKTVGQYTGLCDKNGKKIFEGDILKDSYKDGETEIKFVYTIEYSEKDCGFATREKTEDYVTCLFDIGLAQTSEVIGNIHDNPELLEEQENE